MGDFMRIMGHVLTDMGHLADFLGAEELHALPPLKKSRSQGRGVEKTAVQKTHHSRTRMMT